MLIAHIIFCLLFISSIIALVGVEILKKPTSNTDDIVITAVAFLGAFALVTGILTSCDFYYRDTHTPTLQDVNEGHARMISYKEISDDDTTYYFKSVWEGTNQRNDRDINNLDSVNHQGFKIKK